RGFSGTYSPPHPHFARHKPFRVPCDANRQSSLPQTSMAKNLSSSSDSSPSKSAAPRAIGGDAGLRSALGGLLSDPFRLVLVLAINVAVVVGIVSTAVILRNRKPPPKPITLAMALNALDRGNTAEAQRMAEHLA